MKDMRYMKTPSTINKPWKNKQSDYDECGSSMSYISDAIERRSGMTTELSRACSSMSHISDAIERAAQEMRLKYEETEKEFIFSSIKAFVDTTSTIKISKDELFEAIRLIEKRNYVLKKYDVDIFAVDNANMAAILYSLDSAYDLGVNDGYKKARQEVVDFITKGGH